MLLAVLVPPTTAQPIPEWEQLGLIANRPNYVHTVDFLIGDGTADPALDTLVMFHARGTLRYNPGGEGNDVWGDWYPLCVINCGQPNNGLITEDGTILYGFYLKRSTDSGRTWQSIWNVDSLLLDPLYEVKTLPLSDRPVLIGGSGDDGSHVRSLADGEMGSWQGIGRAAAWPYGLGEVPPSAALPGGRLLASGFGPVALYYSDDGGLTWQPSSHPEGIFDATFTFAADASHPYGGVAYAGVRSMAVEGGAVSGSEVHRSDDGGATWTLAHLFTPEEVGLPTPPVGWALDATTVYATPDGALWASANRVNGASPMHRGRVMRSLDGGATWHRADGGALASANNGLGRAVRQFHLARDGRLYAATSEGVWRTLQPVVAAEAANPPAAPSLAVSVRPNPSSGHVTVTVEAPAAVEMALVDVFDAMGRHVASLHAGPMPAGSRAFTAETRSWAAGVYVARVWNGGRQHSARFTVAR